MKKFLTAMTAFIMMNTSAYAAQYSYGDIVSVIENWQYQQTRVPYEDCTTVRVPTTSSENSAGADALAGMIIGGLLGKGITGNDKGAAAGAVLGGIIGADKSQPKPRQQYREENRCVTKYHTSNEPVQVGYNVQYMYDGHLYEFHTFKRYRNGDKIKLEVRVRPLN
jgi:uncharacterized protein YcfJ